MPDIVLKELQEQVADFHNRWQTAMTVNQQQAETIAAAQATNERLREALQKGHRQLIYKLGGTYKDGYGGSDRDAEAAVLMYEALALPNDTTALDARLAAERERCAKVAQKFEPDERCDYVTYTSDAIRSMK